MHVLDLYDSKGPLKTFGFDDKSINQMAMPYIIFFVIYLGALLLAIYFNVKRKYVTNAIFLTVMIISYMIITTFRLA